MGGGSYSSSDYRAAVCSLSAKGATFKRSATAASTGDYTGTVADILNPRKLKNGIRESCFADGFADATAIAIGIDGTGSMHQVPGLIQKELPNLIDLLVDRGLTDHPNVMFTCFDDEIAMPPHAVFQMSQFEIETAKLIESLNEMIIPGHGGGNDGEAYHLHFYALAHHTKIECFERDGSKGFCFLICDEQPYYDRGDPSKHGTTPAVAKEVFGDTVEKEITMLESVRKTAEKYHIFILRPHHTSHGDDMSIARMWQKLLQDAGENPEHVLEVRDPNSLVSTMVLSIGRILGADSDDMVSVLKAKGAAGVDDAATATQAIVAVAAGAVSVGTASSDIITSDHMNEVGRKR